MVPLLIALASGCYATTSTGYVGYSGTATVTTVAPDLVYVSPGVQVIADYDEPVFYSDGYYWRETNGLWYRSHVHTGGWVSYSAPRHVVSIQNRHSYRRYRPAGYTPRHHDNRPVVRDNRNYRQPVQHDNRRHDAPVVRDNRHQPTVRDNRARPTTRDNRKHDDDDDDRKRRHR